MTATRRVGVIMNGVTGRMGKNQHLTRSILAIRGQGGVRMPDGSMLMPVPLLLGRNPERLKALADEAGGLAWTTSFDDALADPANEIYFDAQLTQLRAAAVEKAVLARKHVYCEKPIGVTTQESYALYRLARDMGMKHGVVQDKLFLPGILKLRRLIESGYFGEILSVRGEFGYWVFTGLDGGLPQRPSWNYRAEDGGGIIADMLCHWRYLLDGLFGDVRAVSCLGATHIPERVNEGAVRYTSTADDAAYATFELEGGTIAQFNSSWCVRVRRDDLLTLQVDGTHASAVAGLRRCFVQAASETPRPVWNPDIASPIDFRAGWTEVPDNQPFDNCFKTQWEMFLRHAAGTEPFQYDLLEGAKGVQLAELGMQSWRERRWVAVPALEA